MFLQRESALYKYNAFTPLFAALNLTVSLNIAYHEEPAFCPGLSASFIILICVNLIIFQILPLPFMSLHVILVVISLISTHNVRMNILIASSVDGLASIM